jgi:hypothetical protein
MKVTVGVELWEVAYEAPGPEEVLPGDSNEGERVDFDKAIMEAEALIAAHVQVPHLNAAMAMKVSQELKIHYDLTKEAERGQLPDGICSLTQLWTEMVSTSLRKLELPDYVAFCEARGLPREWLSMDGSVEYMKLENVLHLATEIEALGSSC